MSTIKPVRIVVVGVGNFGRLHARTIAGLAEAELVGVVDSNQQAINALRQDLVNLRSWLRVEDALRESDADAFIVATHTDSHVDLAEKILKSGRTVLVEKPLSKDLSGAERLAPLIKRDSSNFMAGHVVLFAPELRTLLSEIRRRGGLQYFNAVRHRPVGTRQKYPGESPFQLTMVHDLYVACALLDGREPQKLFGQMRRDACNGSDLALAELRWPGDLWGSLTASFLTPPGMAEDGFDRLEVFADGWAARLCLNPQPLELWTHKMQWPIGLNIHDDPTIPSGWLAEELRCLCRIVRGVSSVPIGARYQDAVQVQRWIETLERSAMENSRC